MGKASRDKGKRRERQLRDLLRSWGLCARRGQQHSGEIGNPDVICENTPDILWESKGREATAFYVWLAEARRMAEAKAKLPIVAYKKNNCPWFFVLDEEAMRHLLIEHSDLIK